MLKLGGFRESIRTRPECLRMPRCHGTSTVLKSLLASCSQNLNLQTTLAQLHATL